jgi:hypothetical protein
MLAVTSNRHTLQRNTNTNEFLHSMRQLLVMAKVVPRSLILVTLMMEALRYSEMWVLTRATWHNIPKDSILHGNAPSDYIKCWEFFEFSKISVLA